MAIKLTTGRAGRVMVWLIPEAGGSPQDAALIGKGKTADGALTAALVSLEQSAVIVRRGLRRELV